MPRYNPATIEPKWQAYWETNQTFAAPRLPKPGAPKLYALDMFPYPSGDGLHVGHPLGWTATDIVCRAARMQGKSVMHPMGFDAFGLPAEEHAIKSGQHPRVQTEKNIANFRRQIKMLALSYDWSRELATTDVEYFRWTQWIFLQIYDTWFDYDEQRGRPIRELPIPPAVKSQGDDAIRAYQDEHRLAYQSEAPVNWCPNLGTVLANEEVVDGKSEVGGHPVVRMPLRQWKLRITAYADRLENDLESLDWSRELATTDVEYFRWTQWIFLQIYDTWFDYDQQRGRPISELPIPTEVKSQGEDAIRAYQDEHRLAYQSEAPVNWCPNLGTVLANEEVVDGKSEVGGHPVVRMPLRQWKLRITAYADRLENDLEALDWSHGIKLLQRNWIGRSTGAEVDFYIGDSGSGATGSASASFATWKAQRHGSGFPQKPSRDVLRIYTTRPDTLFGATYMVIAPEHPFVERLTTPHNAAAVRTYCESAAHKSDLDRTELAKEKTGVFTGAFAINPVNGQPVPIWIADYVLISYGTGAIMAVPAHDERDFEFAQQFHLSVQPVVDPGTSVSKSERVAVLAGGKCYAGNGIAINSSHTFDGLTTNEFKDQITSLLAEMNVGRKAVNYKLRDWLFSRQRFWGEPFPILHELDNDNKPTGRVRAVDEKSLPVDLPHIEDFKPRQSTPLAPREAKHLAERDGYTVPLDKAPHDWLYPTIDGKRYKRETNTMPQWAGSCWYYLRFLDPTNKQAAIDPAIEKAWMPVDLYIGGAEHAVLHLLYARFWHKVLFDRGVVSTPEPFQKLVNQGMILGENGEKMSKSRGNVINPDAIVKEYGADALRLYEMYMGPLEDSKPWSMQDVNGVFNFLNRVWRLILDDRAEQLALNPAVVDRPPTDEENRVLHRTIEAVTGDIDKMKFNTAIARMIEFTNHFTKQTERPRAVLERFVLLLSPFAPHMAEELWQALDHDKTLAYEPWPKFDPALSKSDTIDIPVQINGKVRSKITVPADADAAALEAAARADTRIAELVAGKQIAKVIAVPGRLVSFVVKG